MTAFSLTCQLRCHPPPLGEEQTPPSPPQAAATPPLAGEANVCCVGADALGGPPQASPARGGDPGKDADEQGVSLDTRLVPTLGGDSRFRCRCPRQGRQGLTPLWGPWETERIPGGRSLRPPGILLSQN